MNHTQRIAETARRHRHLSHRMAKEAIETYLELLAEEIAKGEWVDINSIGKVQVVVERGSGKLYSRSTHRTIEIKKRIRTKIRLFSSLKRQCYYNDENGI